MFCLISFCVHECSECTHLRVCIFLNYTLICIYFSECTHLRVLFFWIHVLMCMYFSSSMDTMGIFISWNHKALLWIYNKQLNFLFLLLKIDFFHSIYSDYSFLYPYSPHFLPTSLAISFNTLSLLRKQIGSWVWWHTRVVDFLFLLLSLWGPTPPLAPK